MKLLKSDEWTKLILGIALLLGGIVRFAPGLMAGFPLNDGGMFLSMIRDLRASHYLLPAVTSYNHLNIPFAYPPFGFYLARALSDLFSLSELTLLRWLPPLISTLSILAFYLLASTILDSKSRGALGAAIYALTPSSFGWFVMGGGLTRSLGSFFLILSVWSLFQLFHNSGRKRLIITILFCSLAVLSHPEAGLHTAASCALLWLFYGRTRHSTIQAMIVFVGTILLSSPWWLTVLLYGGLSPFLSALHTGMIGMPVLQSLYYAIFSWGSFIPILMLLRIIGFTWALWKRNFFLVLWVILPYLVEPRSAPSVAYYPLCLLITIAIADAIPALLDAIKRKSSLSTDFTQSRFINLSLILILFYLFVESYLYGFRLVHNSLLPADRVVMAWVSQNTPVDSRFILMTGVTSVEIDPFQEWFPALAERRSQTTIQGFEWTLGSQFFKRYQDLSILQNCVSAKCISDWSSRTGLDYHYVIVQKPGISLNLINDLKASKNYKVVYESNEAIVLDAKLNK